MESHNQLIIAFSGRMRSGKDSCAKYLQETIGDSARIYSFADKLKRDVCINLLGLTEQQCYGSTADKESFTRLLWENMPTNTGRHGYMTCRETLQYVGTEIFRAMYQNVWVDAAFRQIKSEGFPFALITDCRFVSEVEAVKSHGGHVIRLLRQVNNEEHPSESELDNYNGDLYIVDNRKMTIEQQNTAVYNVYQKILNEHRKAQPVGV